LFLGSFRISSNGKIIYQNTTNIYNAYQTFQINFKGKGGSNTYVGMAQDMTWCNFLNDTQYRLIDLSIKIFYQFFNDKCREVFSIMNISIDTAKWIGNMFAYINRLKEAIDGINSEYARRNKIEKKPSKYIENEGYGEIRQYTLERSSDKLFTIILQGDNEKLNIDCKHIKNNLTDKENCINN
jgi:hypothetical protein